MKLKTVRMRRSSPSPLSLALALMITMLCVYLISLSALPDGESDAASAQTPSVAELRMEGLDAAFLCESRTPSQLEARVLAARCAEGGGAGLIIADADGYAVIREAVSPESADETALRRSADGLTLKLTGASGEIAAVSDAVSFLRAQASETGSLAAALENGDTDAASISALMNVYRTQARRALEGMRAISAPGAVTDRLIFAVEAALARLDDAAAAPDPGKIKLIHAAACAEWISILNEFVAASA